MEERHVEERVKSKSQKNVQRIFEKNKEEKTFTKTLTKSIMKFNGIAKLYGGIKLNEENLENKKLKGEDCNLDYYYNINEYLKSTI